MAKLGDVMGEIGGIEASIKQTTQKDSLGQALANLSEGEQFLEERRRENLQKVAGKFLLERVRAQHDQQSCPKVLRRAAELFAKFTHHKYNIIVDERSDPPSFRVFEVFTRIGKGLSELSDGTRIQLLLAVRLAFANQIERGVKLPIFLDDVLTTSDPSRFQIIVESLNVLAAEEKRQIVYLTANPSDAVRWSQTLVKKGVEQSVVAWIGAEMEFALSQAVASGDAFEHRPPECGHCVQNFLADLDLRDLPGEAARFELGADHALPTTDLRFYPAALVVPCGHLPDHAAVAADLGNMAIPNGWIPRRLRSDHCVLRRRYNHIQGLPIPLPQHIPYRRSI